MPYKNILAPEMVPYTAQLSVAVAPFNPEVIG